MKTTMIEKVKRKASISPWQKLKNQRDTSWAENDILKDRVTELEGELLRLRRVAILGYKITDKLEPIYRGEKLKRI